MRHRLLTTYATLRANLWLRLAVLVLYYLAILIALLLMYGPGDFSTPPFIYQGF